MADETKIRITELADDLANLVNSLTGLSAEGTDENSFNIGSGTASTDASQSLLFSSDLSNKPEIRWNHSTQRFQVNYANPSNLAEFVNLSTVTSVTAQRGVKLASTSTVVNTVLEADRGVGVNQVTPGVHVQTREHSRTHGGFLSSLLVTQSDGTVLGNPYQTGVLHLQQGSGVTFDYQQGNSTSGTPKLIISAGEGAVSTIVANNDSEELGLGGAVRLTATNGITITKLGSPDRFEFSNTGIRNFTVQTNIGSGPQTTLQFNNTTDIEVNQSSINTPISFVFAQDPVRSIKAGTTAGQVRNNITFQNTSEITWTHTDDLNDDGYITPTISLIGGHKLTGQVIPTVNLTEVRANRVAARLTGASSETLLGIISYRGNSTTGSQVVTETNALVVSDSTTKNYSSVSGPASIAHLSCSSEWANFSRESKSTLGGTTDKIRVSINNVGLPGSETRLKMSTNSTLFNSSTGADFKGSIDITIPSGAQIVSFTWYLNRQSGTDYVTFSQSSSTEERVLLYQTSATTCRVFYEFNKGDIGFNFSASQHVFVANVFYLFNN